MLSPLKPLVGCQRLAPEERRGTAEEGAVPLVEPALDDAVEHLVLARHVLEGLQIAFERVGIDEEVRRLDKEELAVPREVADRLLQEVACGSMVGVEDGNEFAGGGRQAVVEIARLGVLVARPRQIVDAKLLAERLQRGVPRFGRLGVDHVLRVPLFFGAAVIEQPDGELFCRVVDRPGRSHGVGEKARLFVVCRNEDVDRRQLGVAVPGRTSRRQRLRDDEEADRQHHHAVELCEVEQEARNEILGLVNGGRVLVVRQ